MSIVSPQRNGGAPTKPSARKSIHNHGTHCPFWHNETMLQSELYTKERRERIVNRDTLEKGTDEVDNAMSKFAHSLSPSSIRRNENLHRNSLSSLLDSIRDVSDDDSDLLSKSSPAILSTYYSDELEDDPAGNSSRGSITSANSSPPQKWRLNDSESNSNTSPSAPFVAKRNIEYDNVHPSKASSFTTYFLFAIIVALIAVVSVVYGNVFTIGKRTNDIIYDKFSFYNDINDVGEKYKILDNSILQVQAGIATIFEREDTGSFIFPYNSDRSSFNFVNFNNFVNELASTAARYLRNSTKTIHHVVVDSGNLKLKTDKELMTEYHADVAKTGVMLVKELDKVPANVAMAFHYYCDEYNPLVKKSAIFFTLNMARCSNVKNEKNTHENIEKCLANKWENMPQDNIRPLLNRVVNVVIDVTNNF